MAMHTTTPPLELQRSRPRDVRLTAAGTVLTMVWIALFAGAIVVTILLSRESASQRHARSLFDSTGVTATAHVVRLWRESNEHKTPRVEYAFDANGREVDGRAKLPLKRWQSLRTGDSIDVRYLPTDPTYHVILEETREVMPAWLPFVVGLLMAAGGLGCMAAVRMQRRLLAEGRVARATVTKVTKRHTTHGGSYRSVAFSFPTLSGATVAAKASTSHKSPDVGASVWVVYDPDNPKRSAMYPMQLVKLPPA